MATATDLYKLTAAGQQAGAQQNSQTAAQLQAAKLQSGQAATGTDALTSQWLAKLQNAQNSGNLKQTADAAALGKQTGTALAGTAGSGAASAGSSPTQSMKDQAKSYLDNVLANNGIVGSWAGYPMSDTVIEANNVLNSILAARPGAYNGKYDQQIASLYDQIMNREKFVYDVNKDPLFQQYRSQYLRNGQQAMQDTMGQAAALAGGYGSSWGTTAGYQAYQQYLQALNDKIPELEQRAFERYQYEGDELRNNMSLSLDMDNRDYTRYRDTVEDWKDDRTFEYGRYRDAMQDWKDDRAFDYGMYRDSVSDYYNDRNFGWTMYDAEATRDLNNYWNQMNYNLEVQKFLASQDKSSGGSGGGGSRSSGTSSKKKNTANESGGTGGLNAVRRTDIKDEYRTKPYNNGTLKTKLKQFGTA